MSDRRHPAMPSDHHHAAAYSSGQWNHNTQPQAYTGPNHHYTPSGYVTPQVHPDSIPRQASYSYAIPNDPSAHGSYPSSSRTYPSQPISMYSSQQQPVMDPTAYPAQHSQHNYMSSPNAGRQPYSHNHVGSATMQNYDAVPSNTHGYGMQYTQPSPSPPPMSPHAGLIQAQYPASPPRPFACDMCALSFNRQHDLKRHRETHSGEKPFLCNGGCGKTFTRKDALKRHQLVKQCGYDDNA